LKGRWKVMNMPDMKLAAVSWKANPKARPKIPRPAMMEATVPVKFSIDRESIKPTIRITRKNSLLKNPLIVSLKWALTRYFLESLSNNRPKKYMLIKITNAKAMLGRSRTKAISQLSSLLSRVLINSDVSIIRIKGDRKRTD